jgi:hypothetical protein
MIRGAEGTGTKHVRPGGLWRMDTVAWGRTVLPTGLYPNHFKGSVFKCVCVCVGARVSEGDRIIPDYFHEDCFILLQSELPQP